MYVNYTLYYVFRIKINQLKAYFININFEEMGCCILIS